MDIHHYHSETKQYLGTTSARLDPVATERKGKPVYRIPAHATTTAPQKAPDGKVSVFRDGGWVHSPVIVIGNEKVPEVNLTAEQKKEALIQAEMSAILREQAIERLKERKEI